MPRLSVSRTLACFIVFAVPVMATGVPNALAAAKPAAATTMPQLFFVNFDQQATGAVQHGDLPGEFTDVEDYARVVVQDHLATSKPNAMSVQVHGGTTSVAYKIYTTPYMSHALMFNLTLGSGLTLPKKGYLEIASTETFLSKSDEAELELEASGQLNLLYIDNSGVQHYVYTSAVLRRGVSYSIKLKQVTSTTNGRLQLLVNGSSVAFVKHLNLGTTGVRLFDIGNVWTPKNAATKGHLYFDNVETRGTAPTA